MIQSWSNYEAAAISAISALRNELKVSKVEGKQTLTGSSGPTWEIDAKAWCEDSENFLIIEARCHTSSGLKQEALAAIAFRVNDLGAVGGIVVSPLPLQKGAKLIAASSGIEHVLLSATSTPEHYLAEYMGHRFHGFGFSDSISGSCQVIGGTLTEASDVDQ